LKQAILVILNPISPIIRFAHIDDATALLAYMHRLIAEPDNNIPLLPGELPVDVDVQARQIEMVINSGVSALFLVVSGDEVIGRLDINGNRRASRRHVVSVGISIDERFRGQGWGSALMTAGMEWIAERPYIRRIELEVHARNTGAIRLYERLGFVHEGKDVNRLYQHGQYFDTLRMARWLESSG